MSKPTALRLAGMLWDEIASSRITLRRRITCLRRGHQFVCCPNSHVCARCGFTC